MSKVVSIVQPEEGQIVSDVPAPEKHKGAAPKYPFKMLLVGQSFWSGTPRVISAVAAHKYRNPGWDYTCRREGSGWRIWRVA